MIDRIVLTISKDCRVQTRAGEWCHFPFYYRGVKYEDCTSKDSRLPWCGTAERLNYRDKRYGACATGIC